MQLTGKQFRITSGQIYNVRFGKFTAIYRTETCDVSFCLVCALAIHERKSRIGSQCDSLFALAGPHIRFCFGNVRKRIGTRENTGRKVQQFVNVYMLCQLFRHLIEKQVKALPCRKCQCLMTRWKACFLQIREIAQAFHPGLGTGFAQETVLCSRSDLIENHSGYFQFCIEMFKAIQHGSDGVACIACTHHYHHRYLHQSGHFGAASLRFPESVEQTCPSFYHAHVSLLSITVVDGLQVTA